MCWQENEYRKCCEYISETAALYCYYGYQINKIKGSK